MSESLLKTTSRITVDTVIKQWEEETKMELPLVERDLLLALFTVLLDEAVNISIDETMKKIATGHIPEIKH